MAFHKCSLTCILLVMGSSFPLSAFSFSKRSVQEDKWKQMTLPCPGHCLLIVVTHFKSQWAGEILGLWSAPSLLAVWGMHRPVPPRAGNHWPLWALNANAIMKNWGHICKVICDLWVHKYKAEVKIGVGGCLEEMSFVLGIRYRQWQGLAERKRKEKGSRKHTSVLRCWVSFYCSRVTVSKGAKTGDTALERSSAFSLLQVINPSFPLKIETKTPKPKMNQNAQRGCRVEP